MPSFRLRARSTLAALCLAVGVGLLGSAGSASAAEISDAVTSVSIRETSVRLNQTIHVDFSWKVPDGTAAGDTFRLTLSDNVVMRQGQVIEIRDGSGALIAKGVVSGQDVVFTMTDYGADNEGVTGTGWLAVRFNDEIVERDTTQQVTVTAGDRKDSVPIYVSPVTPQPVARKVAQWVFDPTKYGYPADDHVIWQITTPVFTAAEVGKKVIIRDGGGTGLVLDCATLAVDRVTYTPAYRIVGDFTGKHTLSCSADAASVSFIVTADLVGFAVQLNGAASTTDDSVAEFVNRGAVVIDGDAVPVVGRAMTTEGGGQGVGYKRVSVGDYVWFDTDGDGSQDAGEPGIAGVTLTLTGPDGKPVTDTDGKLVGPTTTDANGNYLFSRLPALPAGSHYTVTITPPAGYTATKAGAAAASLDSSTTSATSGDLVKNGSSDRTLDFGFVKVATEPDPTPTPTPTPGRPTTPNTPAPRTPVLAHTGAEGVLGHAALGLVLMAAGGALVLGRRPTTAQG